MAWLVPALAEKLPQILNEVRDRFGAEWPDYADFLNDEQDEVTAAATAFLQWLVEIAEHPDDTPADDADRPQSVLFDEIGRVQWREGRELTTLLSAYQVGARVAWRHVAATALQLGLDPATLAALAEAVFIFVDQLSSASARGYVQEQSESVAERERLRDELVELLLSDRSDAAAVRGAANRAGWPLPKNVAVILVNPDNDIGQDLLSRLDRSCLIIRSRSMMGAILPDPVRPGRRQRLAQSLRGAGAVVGHPVAIEDLPASVQIAEIAASLQRMGIIDEDPIFAEEHLDAIIVNRDPRLLAALRNRMLAPLADLAPGVADRLTETLASWLRNFGDRRAIAADLHIHPQTVRYRMAQVTRIFGPILDDPDGRARLMLALAWSPTGATAQTSTAAPISLP